VGNDSRYAKSDPMPGFLPPFQEQLLIAMVLSKPAQRALAKVGALNELADHRRDAQWMEVVRQQGDLFAEAEAGSAMPLAPMDPHRCRHR